MARRIESIRGFDEVPGRDTWYAGSAVINGQVVGPPLGIRSMSATADGSAILANVHVGGIPRSTDGGATWTLQNFQPELNKPVLSLLALDARTGRRL